MSRLRSAHSFATTLSILVASGVFGADSASQTRSQPMVSADGTISIPSFDVPLSSYMSAQARERFIEEAENPLPRNFGPDPSTSEARKWTDDWYRPKVARARAIWPVNIEEQSIGGVPTHVITPKDGVAPDHRDLVLINLHGGSFVSGAVWGGLAESIPISGVGKFKVIAADYRMAPEYQFPAADDDITSIYKTLLKTYKPEDIGIYGCSAGGILTAQIVAWFQRKGLPRPGAIGIFCAADAILGGDSRFLAASLDVSVTPPTSPPSAKSKASWEPQSYLGNVSLSDPLVSPVTSDEVLAKFPPTLLITGTRDSAMSSIVHMHSQLVKAGAVADLHLWDGMGHNFLVEMDLPESQEAYAVIAKFFDNHLGAKR